jgi:Ni/Co efflux regulator RcnB
MIGEMRRLTSLLAAVAVVAAPLASAGVALAKDHDGPRQEQHGRSEPRGGPPPRQGGPPQGYRGGEQEYRGGGRYPIDPRSDPRYDPRFESRGDPRGAYRGEQRADPRYDPRGPYAPPPGAYQAPPRRGGYLEQGGPVIEDYGRYRLRAPPRGFDWVRTPGGMALVQQGTGRVYDVVPY